MFRVDVDSLEDYFDFDLMRTSDLQRLDKLIRRSAPGLKRYFHAGTPAGEPGMRFKMIGYGHRGRSFAQWKWRCIGQAPKHRAGSCDRYRTPHPPHQAESMIGGDHNHIPGAR